MSERIYAVKDGSSYTIREIVTKSGYYIVWPGRFSSLESCQKAIDEEMIAARNWELSKQEITDTEEEI